jgi:hypothetical protein
LQKEQAGRGADRLNALLYRRLDAILGEYLSALLEAGPLNENQIILSGASVKP